MVNFAELKAKAEKAKDVSVTKVTNTRDRYSSMPASKVNWDPNWKRAPPPPAGTLPRASTSGPPPPPPSRSRPEVIASGAPPVVPRASRPTDLEDMPAPPAYSPPPPPTRVASGYPPLGGHRETSHDPADRIDWANLSAEDKAAFFGWLDEFFSRYLGIEVGPRAQGSVATPAAPRTQTRLPPAVNLVTRPQV